MALKPNVILPDKIGRYKILKPLGQGGMGSVFLAQDTELDRPVALKIPHLDANDGSNVLERFYREARSAATLRHPNICPVFDIGEFQGRPYLTMAFIEGKSLADFAQTKPLTQKAIAILVRKLALALQEAHQRGIIHRDLKPANIMIDRRGEPIVMDFGLARRVSRDETRLTQTGAAIGTPAYMPPEQISANVELMGPRCDIYSLGVILYELLAGRLPFEGDVMAMLARILTDDPKPPSSFKNIDPALEAICLKAMAKQPGERFGSMAEVAAALMDYLRNQPTAVRLPETIAHVAEETKTSGIRMSMMGGLRSMAQAKQQMDRAPTAMPREPLLKKKAKKRKVPAWGWAVMGGGGTLLLVAILALIFSGGKAGESGILPQSVDHAQLTGPKREPMAEAEIPAEKMGIPNLKNDLVIGIPNVPRSQGMEKAPAGSLPKPVTATPTASRPELDGEWEVVSENWKGNSIPADQIRKMGKTLRISGDQMIFTRQGNDNKVFISSGKIQLNGTTIDFHGTDYFGATREFRGIFEVSGDTLRLAYPNTNAGLLRPSAFASSADNDTLVTVARRRSAVAASSPGEKAVVSSNQPASLAGSKHEATSWTTLFNGRNLNGWKTHPNDKVKWEVKNGILVGSGERGVLYTQRNDYENFHVRVEARIPANGNSGIFGRVGFGPGFQKGYEAQISIAEAAKRTGSLYNFVDVTRQLHQAGQWFTEEMKLDGNHIVIWVNDQKVVDFVDPRHTYHRGHIGLQKNAPGTIVEFRKVEVKELPGQRSAADFPERSIAQITPTGSSKAMELVQLSELPQGQNKSGPWLSPDGLSLYWSDKQGEKHSIWRARRDAPGAAFRNFVRVFGGHDVTLSADLSEMIRVDYDPRPPPGQKFAVFSIKKPSAADPDEVFGDLRFHRKPSEINKLGLVFAPSLCADGLTLYAEQFGDSSLPPNVRFRRSSLSAAWGKPESVPLSGLSKAHVRFPFVSADNKYLFGNHNDSPSGMILMTSIDEGKTFSNPKPILIPGNQLRGKFPRYCEATRELFFGDESNGNMAELYVIRNFDPLVVSGWVNGGRGN